MNSTETLLKLLDSAKGISAKYLLFDSWFTLPKTIVSVVKRKIDVICMLKISSKIHYLYQGEWMNLKEIYKRMTPTAKGNIIGSVTASIRESRKNPEFVEVKIVFVKDRNSKKWLAVLSTNTTTSDEEVIRIYGKRWDIKVFFKVIKFPAMVAIQRMAPDNIRGRIIGVLVILTAGIAPLGIALSGFIIDKIHPFILLAVIGFCITVTGLYLFRNKNLSFS